MHNVFIIGQAEYRLSPFLVNMEKKQPNVVQKAGAEIIKIHLC
jgi:hypothetical protein